jgi:general secretion pathway protein A
MYQDYFHLNEMPFSIAPDPRFLFMSERHREAMAHLLFGVQGEGGIVLLTGEVGTGKTTICRSLLDQLPENIDVALILNPLMSVEELLQTICEEFHIAVTQNRHGTKTFIDALNARLLTAHAQGRRAILIVDEAQNLDSAVLEQLRLLTNLETSSRKLLQIFLIGQPELNSTLARPEMRQVSQRVIARYHLSRLSRLEVYAYISHRLRISGASPLIFPEKLVNEIYRASTGIPRLINLICDRALLGTYSLSQQQVTQPLLRQAINEVFGKNHGKFRKGMILAGLMVIGIGIIILVSTQLPETKFMWAPIGLANTTLTSAVTERIPTSTPAPASTPVPTSTPGTNAETAMPVLNDSPKIIEPQRQLTSTLKWPSNVSLSNNETIAFQSLFKLYEIKIDTQSKVAPCQQAETTGMRCFIGHGGLTDLVQLDQPVLTRLLSAEGKEYYATLMALDQQSATLMIAGEIQRVSLMELANSWFGQYIVVWNAPPDFDQSISLDDQGPSVIWLRHILGNIEGKRDNGSDVFDPALAKRVHAFQLAEGIQPDGVVGPLTVIHLNMRSGIVTQRLVTRKKG